MLAQSVAVEIDALDVEPATPQALFGGLHPPHAVGVGDSCEDSPYLRRQRLVS